MLKKISIGLAAVVVVFLGVAMAQPSTFEVQRSTQIQAPADVVWAEVSSFDQWKAWNPWQKVDPNQTVTVTGEPGTIGHMQTWDGEQTGKGSMTITQATKPTHLDIALSFREPMESEATTALHLQPEGDGVTVTWSMKGENTFIGKCFSLFMDVDEMIGTSYAEGLADLKKVAEESAKKQAEAVADTAAVQAEAAAAAQE